MGFKLSNLGRDMNKKQRQPEPYELALIMMCHYGVMEMYKANPVYSMAMSKKKMVYERTRIYFDAINRLLVGAPYAVVEFEFEQDMAALDAMIDGKKKQNAED